jgi:hypothetical protein
MSRRRCLSQRRLSCHIQRQRPCRFLRRAGPCADGRAATRADCSAVPRARRLPYYFRRRRSCRCWPRLPSLPVPTAELPLAPVFVPLPVPTTELISRGSSLVLISCVERMSRRRCLSQRRFSCHLQCQRPCRFLRRGPSPTLMPPPVPTAVPLPAPAIVPLLEPTAVPLPAPKVVPLPVPTAPGSPEIVASCSSLVLRAREGDSGFMLISWQELATLVPLSVPRAVSRSAPISPAAVSIPSLTAAPTPAPTAVPFPASSPVLSPRAVCRSARRQSPVGCADSGVVAHADPVADGRAASVADDRAAFVANGRVVPVADGDDRAASVADERAAFVANGRVVPVADGRADSGTEVALCSSLALRG